MRRTLKRCPGCGAKNTARPAHKVCDNCTDAIRKWSEHLATANAIREHSTVKLKGAYHWYPMFYFGGPHARIDGFDAVRTELAQLFEEAGTRACVEIFDWKDTPFEQRENSQDLYARPDVRHPKKKGEAYGERAEYPTSEGGPSYHDQYGKIDARMLELLRLLWDRTARFAEMSYIGGLQDGRNLLLQLSSGQLSTGDLDKQDLRIARKRQNAAFLQRKLAQPQGSTRMPLPEKP